MRDPTPADTAELAANDTLAAQLIGVGHDIIAHPYTHLPQETRDAFGAALASYQAGHRPELAVAS
jgi:hypothetical protein